MGLLTGSISVSRYKVAYPEDVDFDAAAFRAIQPGSEVRESVGFIPYEPEAAYEVGARRYAFRVRIDRLRPDNTAVKERLKQLVAVELEQTGMQYVGSRKKKELKQMAEEEIIVRTSPRSKIIECAIDGNILWIGTAAKSDLGTVTTALRRVGVEASPKVPWVDHGLPEAYSDIVETREEAESVHGCHFLKALIGDPEFPVEPESGMARLATHGARIGLSGEVLADLHRYLERGAEVLALKFVAGGENAFTLDGPSFRIRGLSLLPVKSDHWTLDLDVRLERLADLYERLETKFEELMVRSPQRSSERSSERPSEDGESPGTLVPVDPEAPATEAPTPEASAAEDVESPGGGWREAVDAGDAVDGGEEE